MLFILKQLINFQFQFSSLNIFHHFQSFFIKWYADLKKKYLDEFDLKAIIAVDLALHYCLLWSYEYGSRNNLSYLGKRIDLLSNIPSRKDTKPRSHIFSATCLQVSKFDQTLFIFSLNLYKSYLIHVCIVKVRLNDLLRIWCRKLRVLRIQERYRHQCIKAKPWV